ncbi:DUF1972 domain-containing protein [Nocardioides pacificus]
MRIAMLGTRGVPAQYGGFETCVEEVGSRLVDKGHEVVVYCRNSGQELTSYKGMELVNLPAVKKRSVETLSHTGLSVAHLMRHGADAAILFNAGNAPFVPALRARRIPTVIHMDGIESRRAKWAGFGAKYYTWAERSAAGSGLPLIADAQGIADHLREEHGRDSHILAYGAPILSPGTDLLQQMDVQPRQYHLVVARMEPENHVDVAVAGYRLSGSPHPLVVVGSAPYADEYVAEVRAAAGDADVRFVGGVWDQDLLNQLYAHTRSYIHGHSVGGTNPSLLRALGASAPVIAFDVVFNREVAGDCALYFSSPESAAAAIGQHDAGLEAAEARAQQGQRRVEKLYRWDDIADGYEALVMSVARRLATV